MKKAFLALALSSLVSLPVLADQSAIADDIEESRPTRAEFAQAMRGELNNMGAIQGMQELPISRLMFVQAQGGSYMVSTDGRFIIRGEIQDVWHRKTLRTLEDVAATHRMPLANMNFDFDTQLAAMRIGNPDLPRQGLVFADPTSEITKRFVKDVIESDKYHFTIVMMPLVGGEEALKRSVKLLCAADRAAAIQDLAHGTDNALPESTEGCADTNMSFTVFMQEIFRIEQLPHFVREDGLISEGLPEELDEWLEMP